MIYNVSLMICLFQCHCESERSEEEVILLEIASSSQHKVDSPRDDSNDVFCFTS